MVFKRPGGEIRELVFACLRLPDAANKYFDSEQLAELCNVAAGLPAQTELSKRAIANAFSNDGRKAYTEPFREITGVASDSGIFSAFISHKLKGHTSKTTALGRFATNAYQVTAEDRLTRNVNRCSIREWDYTPIDEVVKENYRKLVVAQPSSNDTNNQRTNQ